MTGRAEIRAPPDESGREIRAPGSMEERIAEVVERSAKAAFQKVLDLYGVQQTQTLREPERRKPTDEVRLDTREVGRRCGNATPETVLAWIHSGKLKADRARKRWLVWPAEVERFLSAGGARSAPMELSKAAQDEQVARILGRIHGSKR